MAHRSVATQSGEPTEVVRLIDMEVAEPGPDDVVVVVRAAGSAAALLLAGVTAGSARFRWPTTATWRPR
ncbi:hypothetical protein MUG78_02155 [Gordonia alkaliphila]|uniref:hypothetical protein n=1 Tax=Gordonia alkaliphila TaxID=1053547 RepID=UPI001FF2452E|nr:hypothetical protein [Gordonia alkaliphila]MCK0438294.1 hypothetical protein [Gordonia alkaliphila]